ncbi:tryptophan 2,3-dioxygenase family protein [Actinoplanes flavus]|uniref:Tryptophan 2,3-dioxygenase n=1 Tax=Actinoplanes flavus TaxID=2820290 RepID=A0ABS3URD4_9ACTN|nr:tryptophan 2,3-dioxygenase family protein [Actinoplanes flavus]MBO3741330.1 tryptophan 2,3-dioxygenase [Actinoplanes flavus]
MAVPEPTYGDFLRLDSLLSLPRESPDVHDAHFFFTVHQAFELLFKIILYELDATVAAVAADDIAVAVHCLRRVRSVEDVMVEQVATLETISPGSYALMRRTLGGASGLQSVQFREIECLSGLKRKNLLATLRMSGAERRRLERRLAEPSLWDEFQRLRARRGNPDLVKLYRSKVPVDEVTVLAEAMLDHDEGITMWRARHVLMVERVIGNSAGTGGSSGVSYLRATCERHFFPELWELRAEL